MINQVTWIWYPGDFEIWLHEKISVLREERGRVYPPFWRLDAAYKSVRFRKKCDLKMDDSITIYAEGDYYFEIDGKIIYSDIKNYLVTKGHHIINVKVYNPNTFPTIYVEANEIGSDSSWEASISEMKSEVVGCWNFNSSTDKPSQFKLSTEKIYSKLIEVKDNSTLYDFGKETFGYVILKSIKGNGKVSIYYGESKEEALSSKYCEVFDDINIDNGVSEDYPLSKSRAFRFINVVFDKTVEFDGLEALYEFLPLEYKGNFKSSNEMLNKIWETAMYTLQLNTREFLLDGIKRDRWVWCGDTIQTALMNYYTFYDLDVVKRSYIALRGKEPTDSNVNRIVDYSFYWFIGINDLYLYSGSCEFIENNYDKMVSLMDFCLSRLNKDGLVEGQGSDWTYVDWAEIDNRGEVSTEQLLLIKSLFVMEETAHMMKDFKREKIYGKIAEEIKLKTFQLFWDKDKEVLLHNRVEGKVLDKVTKYPSVFALLFDYLDSKQQVAIKNNVLLNDNIQKITTPYMRFYELSALCQIGESDYAMKEILDYWGGMINLGATSFWEAYDPALKGEEQYAFYGRPFGKSLCHGWGASPLYLLGKYFLGVKPLTPGYESFEIAPKLGGLEWIEGEVPTAKGNVYIYKDKNTIKVKIPGGKAYLRFASSTEPTSQDGVVKYIGDNIYELELLVLNKEVSINYEI